MSDTHSAEQAFMALRAEVEALRHAVEAVRSADYGPTLGAIVKEIRVVNARVEANERVLREGLAIIPRRIEPLRLPGEMTAEKQRLQHIADRLDALIEQPAEARTQRRQRFVAGAVGAVVGIVGVWLLAATLPLGAGDWIAAIPLGAQRWQAGERLMWRADPDSFGRIARLAKACPPDIAVEACEAELALAAVGPPSGGAAHAAGPDVGRRPEPADAKARPRR